MIRFNIEKLLKRKNKSKYWLCQNMNITSRNLNRVIHGETSSISFKYLEELCKYLDCTIDELINMSCYTTLIVESKGNDDTCFINNKHDKCCHKC